MSVAYSDVVFVFDFSRTFMSGGTTYLFDYGPSGYHFAFPGGALNPTSQMDGSMSFDGGDHLALPATELARFYARMPTAEMTFMFVRSLATSASTTRRIFSCWDSGAGGTNNGIIVFADETTAGAAGCYQMQNGAALPRTLSSTQPLSVSGRNVVVGTVESAPRGMHNQQSVTVAWAAGAFGTCVYDQTVVPRIGMDPDGANPTQSRLYYLALIRGAISQPDLAFYSRLLSGGVRPWCWRQ